MKPLIIYHANCADGFGAAYAAWMKFGDNAEYRPMQYGQYPNGYANRDVFVLDFSFPRDVLIQMSKLCNIQVIDHHKTAEKDLSDLPFCIFDMTKSGAVLAWEYFHPDTDVPWLIKYVQDRDLWRWELPNSREVSAALASWPPVFALWHGFIHRENEHSFVVDGAAILRANRQYVKSIMDDRDNLNVVSVGGYKVMAANSRYMISELGNELAKGSLFGVVYFILNETVVVSLRSTESGADVSEIAKLYGGGGHARAAGFTVPLSVWAEMYVQGDM